VEASAPGAENADTNSAAGPIHFINSEHLSHDPCDIHDWAIRFMRMLPL